MKVVSLGCNCDIGFFIRHNFRHHSYPFDWLWTTLDFIIDVFEKDYFEFTECEKLNAVPTEYHMCLFNNNCDGGLERVCSALSVHDADHMTEPQFREAIPMINEKYKRRFARLYDLLNGDEPVLLVRKTLAQNQGAVIKNIDTTQNLNRLRKILAKFKAPITLCVLDEEKYIDRTTLDREIELFDTFQNLYSYVIRF